MITTKKRLNRRWLWSLVYGTILGASGFSLLVAWAGLEDIWYQIADVDGGYLAIYVGLTIGTYLLRAWRFALLIGANGILARLYGIVSVHNLMVNLLPLSGGELSYPFLLKHYGISSRFLDGVPSIILARLQDIVLSGFLLGAALLWVASLRGMYADTLVNALLCALLFVGLGALIYRISAVKSALFRRIVFWLFESLASIKNIDGVVWLRSFIIALVARVTAVIATFYLIQAVGVYLSFPTVFLICSAYVFLPLLPINTVAGLGITEAFLVTFFVGSGIDQKTAAVASIHVHLLQLMIAASLGLLGTLYLQCISHKRIRFTRNS